MDPAHRGGGYAQRHLPTGGVEIHVPVGGRPRLVGPLTGPMVERIPAHATIVGVRFTPGSAPPLPVGLDDLVDLRVDLADVWPGAVDRLADAVSGAASPEQALLRLQDRLVHELQQRAARPDRLVAAAVGALMPWRPVPIKTLASHLALSSSQLRRRCVATVGVTPKVLQRTLRLQGFLALAQAGATATSR